MTPAHPFPFPREDVTMLKRLYRMLDEFEDTPAAPAVGAVILMVSMLALLMLPGLAVQP